MKTHFSKKPALFFSLLLILSSLASPAGATESPVPPRAAGDPLETSRFGLNPGIGALDWDPAEMFADVMKTFREVTAPDGVTPVARDAQGWPLADCRFLVWAGLTRPIETYHLKFTGSAASIVGTGATVSNIQYNAGTNTTTADVLLDGSDALYLAFTGTAGGVKNVQLMMPGHNFGETWNHAFLSALAPVKVIRLMDFTATNWNQEVNWSERTQPDAATQQSTGPGYGWQGKGIAWEYAIDLLNATNKDGWINIPAEVTDAYVASLIDLIQNGGNGFAPLETERKLYIEYSNELWNGMFDQAQFNHEQAVLEVNAGGSPLNFDGETNEWYWAWRRVGKRIVEISDQFRAAFGDEQMMTRFRPVLAWQYDAGQATAPQQLDFISKYYGTNQWGYADPHPVNYYLWCGGGALYYHKKPVAEDPDWQNAVITDSKYASAFGIHFCNYEGAMYFDSDTDPDWDASWVTQRMLDRQQFYEEHGGSLFMFFTLAATWENGLGHVRTIRNLDTPKYNGILQLSQQAQAWQNTYGAALPMNTDGGQFSLIEGDWESPHAGATAISPNAWRAYHFDADAAGYYKVWIEYRSSQPIGLNLYAGSELLATITNNTAGNTTTSATYSFYSEKGLKAIRVLNLGSTNFDVVTVHVTYQGPASDTTFVDVPSTHWAWSWIETLYDSGITGGCGTNPLIFCPDASVTRAQMAVFLERGMNGATYTPPTASGAVFTDVPADYWAAAWIEQLYAEGITAGCGANLYCPESVVTRDQMAIFLLRAEHGNAYTPPAAAGVFTDVPVDHWAAAWIEQLASEGITAGCGGDNYCPAQPVTRAQMAVFLVKTFNLP